MDRKSPTNNIKAPAQALSSQIEIFLKLFAKIAARSKRRILRSLVGIGAADGLETSFLFNKLGDLAMSLSGTLVIRDGPADLLTMRDRNGLETAEMPMADVAAKLAELATTL